MNHWICSRSGKPVKNYQPKICLSVIRRLMTIMPIHLNKRNSYIKWGNSNKLSNCLKSAWTQNLINLNISTMRQYVIWICITIIKDIKSCRSYVIWLLISKNQHSCLQPSQPNTSKKSMKPTKYVVRVYPYIRIIVICFSIERKYQK